MKPRRIAAWLFPPARPLRWLLPGGLLLALFLLQLRLPDWSRRLEAWSEDLRFTLRGPTLPRNPITILALDEASFQLMGELRGENIRLWPRRRWAGLLQKISAAGPRLIVLDVLFDTPGWEAGGDTAGGDTADGDALLAQALAGAGNVLLAANAEARPGPAGLQHTLSLPLPELAQSAAGVGLATFPQDADGGVRALTLLWSFGDQTYPALPLLAATAVRGAPVAVPAADLGEALQLRLNFRGPPGTFPTISMAELWLGTLSPQALQGQIVLVGYTTQQEQDLHLTPFARGRQMPGVELQATALDNLLSGDWLRRPPGWLPPLLVLLLGLSGLLPGLLPRPGWGVLAWLGLLGFYLALAGWLFAARNLLLPLAAPALAALLTGGAVLGERLLFAEREKRLLSQRFASMMSPERLRRVLQDWEALRDPNRPEKHAAVLFADLRNFTHASETLMRQGRHAEMVRFLTAYLDAMAQAVFRHGGVIYRTLGDGLLILVGLPEEAPEPEWQAVQCALAMAQAARELQPLWPLGEELPLGMGIGVHCGPLVDAVIGRGRRLDYVVIGDAANTAARIEALCKEVAALPLPPELQPQSQLPPGVTVLISQEIYQAVAARVWVDDSLPEFAARGKAEPLRVYRLLGLRTGE